MKSDPIKWAVFCNARRAYAESNKAKIAANNKEYRARPEIAVKERERAVLRAKNRSESERENRRLWERNRFGGDIRARFAFWLLKSWKITAEDYARLANDQNMACAICGHGILLDKNTVLDHCHRTGVRRGLIHRQCNSAIGFFDDRVELLEAAAAYLRRYQG